MNPNGSASNITSSGSSDAFVAKYNESGDLIWAKAMGGQADDKALHLAIDDQNNIYLTGTFASTNGDFDPSGSQALLSSAGAEDVFIMKINNSGSLMWAQSFGNANSDYVTDIEAYGLGVYLSGKIKGLTDFVGNTNSSPPGGSTNYDGYVVKLSPTDGSYRWHSFLGGTSGDDEVTSLDLRTAGVNALFAGGYVSGDQDASFVYGETTDGTRTGTITGYRTNQASYTGATIYNGVALNIQPDHEYTTGLPRFTSYASFAGQNQVQSVVLELNGHVHWLGRYAGELDADISSNTASLPSTTSRKWDGFIVSTFSSLSYIASDRIFEALPSTTYDGIDIKKAAVVSDLGSASKLITIVGNVVYGGYFDPRGRNGLNFDGDGNLIAASTSGDESFIASYTSNPTGGIGFIWNKRYVHSLANPGDAGSAQGKVSQAYSLATKPGTVDGDVYVVGANKGTNLPIAPSGIGASTPFTTTTASTFDGYIQKIASCTPVTPSVSISASQTTVCSGSSVTFSSTVDHGGTSPTYQWKINGSAIGAATNATFTRANLTNNDKVSCEITSSLTECVSTLSAVSSNEITITTTAGTTVPSLSITATSTTTCAGQTLSFTAHPVNGGTFPEYFWKKNGSTIPFASGSVYTANNFANGDQISCSMVADASCLSTNSALSNTLALVVGSGNVAAVSISANKTVACSSEQITVTATPSNGGSSPSYEWQINGLTIPGVSGESYTSTFADNDEITVIMTSSDSCTNLGQATSSPVIFDISQSVTPTFSVTASQSSVCSGTPVTFTSDFSETSGSNTYRWFNNNIELSETAASFTSSSFAPNDVIHCEITSNLSCIESNTLTSNAITLGTLSNLVPTIDITASSNTICGNGTIAFSSSVTNAGTTPSYQWKLNGSNVGSDNATYSNASLADGDIVSCELTSNAACTSTSNATSNAITMTAAGTFIPSIAISSSSSTICQGETVLFTSTNMNGGASPSYQWKINGTGVGTNSANFSSSSLNDGDEVTCELISSAQCLATDEATSNAQAITVAPQFTPTVTITSSQTNICSGSSVSFDYQVTEGAGQIASFQWYKNDIAVSSEQRTYSSSLFQDGDVIKCEVNSNSACATTSMGTSNLITLTSTATVTPTISLSSGGVVSSSLTICDGASATLDATITNGGSSPTYQWKVNGSNVGTNQSSFTSSQLQNLDDVSCVLTSNAGCTTTSSATSSTVTVNVSGVSITPSASLTATSMDICSGTEVTITAAATDAGGSPTYQWTKNNQVIAGVTGTTFTSSDLAHADVIGLNIFSDDKCASGAGIANNVNMTVRETPSDQVILDVNTLIAIEANAVYGWGDCIAEGPVAGETAQTFSPKTNGTYAVQITKNGCEAISDCTPFALTTVSIKSKVSSTWSIFPNPTSGSITFSDQLESNAYIYSGDGQLVKVLTPSNQNVYSLSDLTNGVYILTSMINGQSNHQKLILEK